MCHSRSSHHPRVKERSLFLCPSVVPDGKSTYLGLCRGKNLALCRVWFLISLGVAPQVENDVWRIAGDKQGQPACLATRGEEALCREGEMGVCDCVNQKQRSPRGEAVQPPLGKPDDFGKKQHCRKEDLLVNLVISLG